MDEEITAEIDSVSLSGRSMLYPVCRVKMMYYSCGANVVELSNFKLLTMEGNFLPHRIMVVMVREDAVHGNYNRDPFNYQHFNENAKRTLCKSIWKIGNESQAWHSFGRWCFHNRPRF